MLIDLRFLSRAPMRIYYDNNAAIDHDPVQYDHTKHPVQYDHTKHIEVDCHLIKEKIQSRLICTPYVRTGDQLANVFTKGLSSAQF